MLGSDFLGDFVVLIDYPERRVALLKKHRRIKGLRQVAKADLEIRNRLALAKCRLPDDIETYVIVDTGHIWNMQFYADMSEHLELKGPLLTRLVGGAAESHEVSFGQLDWIECGSLRLEPVQVGIHPLVTPNSFETSFKPALLGNGILERYVVEIDFLNGTLRFFRR